MRRSTTQVPLAVWLMLGLCSCGGPSRYASAPAISETGTHRTLHSEPTDPYNEDSSRLFHGKPDGEAVRVPFTLREGLPLLNVQIGRQTVPCVLDTGANLVYWPSSLRIPGDRIFPSDAKKLRENWLSGRSDPAKCIVVPSLRIGGFELREMPTFQAIDTSYFGGRSHSNTPQTAILGTSAFQHVILTIDYRRREITIQRRTGSTMPHESDMKAQVFTTYEGEPDQVVIRGRLAGRSSLYEVDTGCSYLVISRRFAERRWRHHGRTVSIGKAQGASVSGYLLPRVSGVIGKFGFTATNASVVGLPDSEDALLGDGFLQAYLVVIDFDARRLLLEPNVAGDFFASQPRSSDD